MKNDLICKQCRNSFEDGWCKIAEWLLEKCGIVIDPPAKLRYRRSRTCPWCGAGLRNR